MRKGLFASLRCLLQEPDFCDAIDSSMHWRRVGRKRVSILSPLNRMKQLPFKTHSTMERNRVMVLIVSGMHMGMDVVPCCLYHYIKGSKEE